MAAKRPVVVVAVGATVVAIAFLALFGNGANRPVVTRAGGAAPAAPTPPIAGGDAAPQPDPKLVRAGHPSSDAPRPGEIAAIVGGSVVLLDSTDGHTLRTLATHTEAMTGGFPHLEGLALTPDGRQVFYALAGDCGPSTIYRVATDGRTAPVGILSGVSPAVSPDGRKLAYAVATPGLAPSPTERQCQNALVVRDLNTGAEHTWRYPDTPDYSTPLYRSAVISEIAWAPDSTRLAYTLSYEGDSISILDTESETDLSQTEEVVIPDGGGNSSHPAWQASTGLLALFNTRFECCFDDNYTGPPRTLLVNPERRLGTPLLAPGRRVTALDFDASGGHLLFVDGGRLYRRSGTDAPVPLATGVTAADW
jgi:hypothetical protein